MVQVAYRIFYASHSLNVPSVEKIAPIEIGPTDILKLAFTVVAKEGDQVVGTQPHQTFLRFYDKSSGEEGIIPVRVAQNGKAKFELVSPQSCASFTLVHLVRAPEYVSSAVRTPANARQ